jgi:hypothetical protein
MCLFTVNSYSAEVCTKNVSSEELFETMEVKDNAPDYLKDAVITVKLVNGQEHTFNADEFKIVKRVTSRTISKMVLKETNSCISYYKNRLSVLLGKGTKDGLDKQVSKKQVDVSNTQGEVLGAQYQRSLTERLSLGVQVQNNKTNSLMLGYDF